MALEFTVLVPARNAAATVERALRSLDDPQVRAVILIDDFSDDDTVDRALAVGDARLRIVRPREHRNVPFARNRGLPEVRTPWLIWCDADDAFEPGRVSALAALLGQSAADCASDGVRLFDGPSGCFLRDLPIPGFVREPGGSCRLFERNFLPGVGHLAVRTELAQRVGYDDEQSGGDDYDFALRLLRAGARLSCTPHLGYRMYAYPGSDSRRLDRQNAMVARALRKHSYDEVALLFRQSGFSSRVTAWALVSMACFRTEYETGLRLLEEACPPGAPRSEVLEPDGPFPVAEGWRYAFTSGTLSLLLRRPALAVARLREALGFLESADTLNNLGVALWQEGSAEEARACFAQALKVFPGYLDAQLNLRSDAPHRITALPLRRQPSRNDYGPTVPN